jgi:hypothetical protein
MLKKWLVKLEHSYKNYRHERLIKKQKAAINRILRNQKNLESS